jgi:hypothetical protein
MFLDNLNSGITTSSRRAGVWQHRGFGRALQFFIERNEKVKARPILRVTVLERFLETRKGSEGRIQALQVEIVQGGAIDPCYAVASFEAPSKLLPDFSLLWLLGGTRPRLTESILRMQETSDAVTLIPHVPMLVALLVAERRKDTGKIDFGFGSTRFWLEDMKKHYDHFDMSVHLAGKELKDEKPTSFRFRLNLNSPWEELGFVEVA